MMGRYISIAGMQRTPVLVVQVQNIFLHSPRVYDPTRAPNQPTQGHGRYDEPRAGLIRRRNVVRTWIRAVES